MNVDNIGFAVDFDAKTIRAFSSTRLANDRATDSEDTFTINPATIAKAEGATVAKFLALYNEAAAKMGVKPRTKFANRNEAAEELGKLLSAMVTSKALPVQDGKTVPLPEAPKGGRKPKAPAATPVAATAKGKAPAAATPAPAATAKGATKAPAAATAKGKAPAAATPAPAAAPRGRASEFAGCTIIATKATMEENPRREGGEGWHVLEVLREAKGGRMTYEQLVAGFNARCKAEGKSYPANSVGRAIRWDLEHGGAVEVLAPKK